MKYARDMLIKNLFGLAAFSLVLGALPGCIEHTYNLTVLPEGGIEVFYQAKGDLMDFSDDGQLLPDSTVWEYKTWIEEQREEKVRHVEARLNVSDMTDLDNRLNWRKQASDTLHLAHQFSLTRRTNLLGYIWSFSGVLKSRRFDELYGDMWEYIPEECRILDDSEKESSLSADEIKILEEKFALGVIQWNINRYTRLFGRVWRMATIHQPRLADTTETILSIARTGWEEDLHLYLNALNVKNPSTQNLDWWSDLRPVFLGHMVDLTGSENVDLFSRIGDAFEKEYQITKDIEDDKYIFNVKFPGRKVNSNADTEENGICKWELPGKDLRNGDLVMFARKFEISSLRVAITAFLIVLILGLVRRVIIKRRKHDTGF